MHLSFLLQERKSWLWAPFVVSTQISFDFYFMIADKLLIHWIDKMLHFFFFFFCVSFELKLMMATLMLHISQAFRVSSTVSVFFLISLLFFGCHFFLLFYFAFNWYAFIFISTCWLLLIACGQFMFRYFVLVLCAHTQLKCILNEVTPNGQ